MFDGFLNGSELISTLTFVFGSLAGYRAGQLVHRRGPRALRRSARSTLILLDVALFGVFALLAFSIGLLSYGWIFASNRIVVALPPMIIATAFTIAWSMPRLRRLRRRALAETAPASAVGAGSGADKVTAGRAGAAEEAATGRTDATRDAATADRTQTPTEPPAGRKKATVSAALRHEAADPRLVVPIQALGVAGLLSEYVLMLLRPGPPYTSKALVVNAILLVVAGLLWWRQTRRRAWLSGPEAQQPRLVFRLVRGVAGLVLVAAVVAGTLVVGMAVTQLPDTFDMSTSEQMDFGGGPEMVPAHHGTMSVADLTGGADVAGKPDKSFTLTAVKTRLTVGAGRTVDTWAYNGQVPGPTLTVNEGDLVEVTLINQIPDVALTVHWHGLDVPNSQDGVPGVTQDAVRTGQQYVYRFRVHQVGTFWYHSHQSAFDQVDRGLYGALVALPRGASPDPYDIAVTVHDWKVLKKDPLSRTDSAITFDRAGGLTRRAMPAGRLVRLRVVNTGAAALSDEVTPTFVLTGTSFRVAATDGSEINQPGELPAGTRIPVGTGGRVDLAFTMPDGPVRLTDLEDVHTGLVLSPDGAANAPAPPADGPLFERRTYGAPAPTPFGAKSKFDRRFTLVLDDRPGFYDGQFTGLRTINGKVFPDTPMLMVREGDLAEVTVASRGHATHPMHLHGHQVLVLSKNGKPVTGSPWWTDTVEVHPGDSYVMAFRANNPGIWMDHCHNLHHAATGMVMHLGYEGVTSPYRAGRATGNMPEGDDYH